MTFSPVDAAFEGFRLIKRAPVAVLLWCVLYLVITAAVLFLIAAPLLSFITSMTRLESMGVEPSPGQVFGAMGSLLAAYALLLPIALVGNAVFYAAVSRAVTRPSESAFGYMRLGGDELRLIVVHFVQGLVFGAIGMVVGGVFAVLAALLVGGAAAATGDSGNPGPAIAAMLGLQAIVWLVVMPLLIWIGVKLSLTTPIVIAERRIAIFDSWGLTKGRFWGLLGMGLLAYVLASLISMVAMVVVVPVFLFSGAGIVSVFQQMETTGVFDGPALLAALGPAIVICGLLLTLVGVIQSVVMIAPFSKAYLEIKGLDAPRPPVDSDAPLL